jgi:uncharacterized membrane protein YccC
MVLDLMAQLDRECAERNKIESLLRELLDARRNRKSEQLSTDQLALFAAAYQARQGKQKRQRREMAPMTMMPPLAPPGRLPRRRRVAGSLFRDISSASVSCMIWRIRKSTAPLPAGSATHR